MGCRTLPSKGAFSFKCAHCEFDTKKTPSEIKGESKSIKTYFCGQCKEMTLIKIEFGVASVFKVES